MDFDRFLLAPVGTREGISVTFSGFWVGRSRGRWKKSAPPSSFEFWLSFLDIIMSLVKQPSFFWLSEIWVILLL